MSKFQIWRFESQLIRACGDTLNEALRLVGCDLSPKVFLVGYNHLTGFTTVIPEEHDFDTTELDGCLRSIVDPAVSFPDVSNTSEEDWNATFQSHGQYLSQCWDCFQSFFDVNFSWQFRMVAVSSCCEVNSHIVSIVATYSQLDYEKYPRLDLSVLRDFGRWPSLHFVVVEAVLRARAKTT
jgi:hypothetical protein